MIEQFVRTFPTHHPEAFQAKVKAAIPSEPDYAEGRRAARSSSRGIWTTSPTKSNQKWKVCSLRESCRRGGGGGGERASVREREREREPTNGVGGGGGGGGWDEEMIYLWWNLCIMYLFACQVRVSIGGSGLCCCVCVTSLERLLTPLFGEIKRECVYSVCAGTEEAVLLSGGEQGVTVQFSHRVNLLIWLVTQKYSKLLLTPTLLPCLTLPSHPHHHHPPPATWLWVTGGKRSKLCVHWHSLCGEENGPHKIFPPLLFRLVRFPHILTHISTCSVCFPHTVTHINNCDTFWHTSALALFVSLTLWHTSTTVTHSDTHQHLLCLFPSHCDTHQQLWHIVTHISNCPVCFPHIVIYSTVCCLPFTTCIHVVHQHPPSVNTGQHATSRERNGIRSFLRLALRRVVSGQLLAGTEIPAATLSPPQWFCIKIGSDESRFNASFVVRGRITIKAVSVNHNFWRGRGAEAENRTDIVRLPV